MKADYDFGLLEIAEPNLTGLGEGCAVMLLCIIGVVLAVLGAFLESSLYPVWITLAAASFAGIVYSWGYEDKTTKKRREKLAVATKFRGVLVKDSTVMVSDCVITWGNRDSEKPQRRFVKNIEEVSTPTPKRSESARHDLIVSVQFDDDQLIERFKFSLHKITLVDGKNEIWSLSLEKDMVLDVLSKGVITALHLRRHEGIVQLIRLVSEAITQSGCMNLNFQCVFFPRKGEAFGVGLLFGLLGAAYVAYSDWRSSQKLKEIFEYGGTSLRDPETGETLGSVLDRLNIQTKVIS